MSTKSGFIPACLNILNNMDYAIASLFTASSVVLESDLS